MLDKFRRHRNSTAAKIVLYALAGSFVIGFAVLPSLTQSPVTQGTVVARVDGEPIYKRDVDMAVANITDQYRQQYGAQFDERMLENMQLERIAVETLINRRAILAHAQRTGLKVSDEEIRDYVLGIDAFKNANGQFDPDLYNNVLRSQGRGLTPAKFEQDAKQSILISRVRELVNNSVMVTDDQLRELFVAEREKANLNFVAVAPQDVMSKVEVSDEDLEAYFAANQENFVLPERRVFSYLLVSPSSVMKSQQVSDDEVKAAYEARIDEFKGEEEINAAHILIKPDGESDAAWNEARKRAEEVKAQLEGGEPFAKLAKAVSEDATAENGGELGWFGRGQMVGPFEDTAFSLEPGEISDPVRTRFGYHVIKVVDKRGGEAQPLEEVREQLLTSLKREKAVGALERIEAAVAEELKAGQSIEDVASKHGLELMTSEPLAQAGRIPGVLNSQPVLEKGFSLKEGESSELIEAGGMKVAVKVEEIQPSRQQELSEVKAEVEQAVRRDRAQGVAATQAAKILKQARAQNSLTRASGGFEVQETGEFAQIEGEVPGIGRDQDLYKTAFTLRKESPIPDRTFNLNGKYYVIELKSREHADLGEFEEVRDELARQVRSEKEDQVFQQWVQAARGRVEIEYGEGFEPPKQPSLPGGQG